MRPNLRPIVVLLLGGLLVATLVTASTYSNGPGRQPHDSDAGPSAGSVYRTLTLVVKDIAEDNTLTVLDERTEQELTIRIPADVKIVAQAKKEFDGRKKVKVDDLSVGRRLRLTYNTQDGTISRVKVLKLRAS